MPYRGMRPLRCTLYIRTGVDDRHGISGRDFSDTTGSLTVGAEGVGSLTLSSWVLLDGTSAASSTGLTSSMTESGEPSLGAMKMAERSCPIVKRRGSEGAAFSVVG